MALSQALSFLSTRSVAGHDFWTGAPGHCLGSEVDYEPLQLVDDDDRCSQQSSAVNMHGWLPRARLKPSFHRRRMKRGSIVLTAGC